VEEADMVDQMKGGKSTTKAETVQFRGTRTSMISGALSLLDEERNENDRGARTLLEEGDLSLGAVRRSNVAMKNEVADLKEKVRGLEERLEGIAGTMESNQAALLAAIAKK
jgi:hypothetical protein